MKSECILYCSRKSIIICIFRRNSWDLIKCGNCLSFIRYGWLRKVTGIEDWNKFHVDSVVRFWTGTFLFVCLISQHHHMHYCVQKSKQISGSNYMISIYWEQFLRGFSHKWRSPSDVIRISLQLVNSWLISLLFRSWSRPVYWLNIWRVYNSTRHMQLALLFEGSVIVQCTCWHRLY